MNNNAGNAIVDCIAILIQFDHSCFDELWLFLLWMIEDASLPIPWDISLFFIICRARFTFLFFYFLFGLRFLKLSHLLSIFCFWSLPVLRS